MLAGPRGRPRHARRADAARSLVAGQDAAEGRRCPGLARRADDGKAAKAADRRRADRRLARGCRRRRRLHAEAAQRILDQQGVPGQEVRLDLRRRRLGLRHRLRRPRPRAGLRRGREHLRVRHRGLLQHRRPGFQGFQHRSGGAVRRRRQGHQEEEPRRDRHELWLRVRGAGRHGRQAGPDASRPSPRPRHIHGPSIIIALLPLRDALHQGRHEQLPGPR